MAFLLNSQAQGVSGKNEQSTQTPRRGAECSCIGCIGLRPALTLPCPESPSLLFVGSAIEMDLMIV